MTDEVEHKLETTKIQKASDAAQKDGIISEQTNQDVHGEAFARAHVDDKYPSGFMPAIHERFGIRGDLTASDTGIKREKANEKAQIKVSIDANPSYVEGLKAIGNDEEAQGKYSIAYIERKTNEARAKENEGLIGSATRVPIKGDETEAAGFPGELQSDTGLQPDIIAQVEVSDKIQIADKPKEKPAPPEGVAIPFKDFIRKYKTPFVDAYWHSKALKEGPGKSKTYEDIIEALDSSPWKEPNELKIKFDRNAKDTFYDARSSTLIMKASDDPALQVEHVAHEGYHATHQGLRKLWFEGTQAQNIEAFVKCKADLEVQSFMTEIQVHNDITKYWKDTKPVTYEWKQNGATVKTDLDTLFDPKHPNTTKLRQFLMFDATTEMDINGVKKIATYDEYYRSIYDRYRISWRAAHADILQRYKTDPAVKSKMDTMKDF